MAFDWCFSATDTQTQLWQSTQAIRTCFHQNYWLGGEKESACFPKKNLNTKKYFIIRMFVNNKIFYPNCYILKHRIMAFKLL